MIKLIKKFVGTVQSEGLGTTLTRTRQYLFRHTYYRYLHFRWGDWNTVQDINGSEMYLNIHPDGPHAIERELARHGVREPGSTATYERELTELKRKTDGHLHVFDIGANVGYFVLLAAKVLGDQGTVHAIEAEPNNVDRLQQNVSLNEYSNVTARQIAAGANRTTLELDVRSTSNTHRMAELGSGEKPNERIDVDVYPIDQIATEAPISENDAIVLRMDVEGYEHEVFKGAKDILKRDVPIFVFVELHSSLHKNERKSIIDQLERTGFTPLWFSMDGGTTIESLQSFTPVTETERNAHFMAKKTCEK